MSYFNGSGFYEGYYQGNDVLPVGSAGQFGGFNGGQPINGVNNHQQYNGFHGLIGDYPPQQPYQPLTVNPQQIAQPNPPSTQGTAGMMGVGYQYDPNTTAAGVQPAYGDPQQYTLQQIQGMQATDFWNEESYFYNGVNILAGTPAELWDSRPDMRVAMVDSFEIWQRDRTNVGSQGSTFIQPDEGNDFAMSPNTGHDTGNQASSSKKKKRSNKKGLNRAPKSKSKRYYGYQPDYPVAQTGDLAPYVADPSLMSPTACRDYLAYPDPSDIVRPPKIPNDDWKDVANRRFHEFTGRIFDVLLHPYAPSPPEGIEMEEASKIEKYHKQQQKATQNVGVLLGTPEGVKSAKAQCFLLVDAVIFFHQHGLSKYTWGGYRWYVQKGQKIDRRYKLDLDLICSARLEKIVDIVKGNKLISEDILESRNFNRIAQDPSWYLEMKFVLFSSNHARQERN